MIKYSFCVVSQTTSAVLGEPDLPGGGVEAGEDVTTAIVRELEEEAGVEVQPDALDLLYATTEESAAKIRIWFICHVASSEVQLSDEHDAYWWQTSEEALVSLNGISWATGLHFAIEHGLIQNR